MKRSAGILLFRRTGGAIEVFLAHPGGPFWAKRDAGAWTIPKGEIDEGEDPLDAAKREFAEEIGVRIEGDFIPLKPIRQKGGKMVLAWAVEGECDPSKVCSNTFELEWPPKSGRKGTFPEIDRADWFTLEDARRKILDSQVPLLNELEETRGRTT
jgi:predicted NUDIX family NTP pyrophosphohydrolase